MKKKKDVTEAKGGWDVTNEPDGNVHMRGNLPEQTRTVFVSTPPRVSRTQAWLNRLFYISRSMMADIKPAEFEDLRSLLEELRVQRDSKQFPEEP